MRKILLIALLFFCTGCIASQINIVEYEREFTEQIDNVNVDDAVKRYGIPKATLETKDKIYMTWVVDEWIWLGNIEYTNVFEYTFIFDKMDRKFKEYTYKKYTVPYHITH